jgi:hypothetical protein
MRGQPETNLGEARRWLAQASEDWSTAERLSKTRNPRLESRASWLTYPRRSR